MITSGYDLIMVIWGLIFITAATLFIILMNRVFQFEERRQDSQVGSAPPNPQPLPPNPR
jgi:hypothetical protein